MIQLNADLDGQIARDLDLPQEEHASITDQQAEKPARDGNQQAFGEQLADQPLAPGANRQA